MSTYQGQNLAAPLERLTGSYLGHAGPSRAARTVSHAPSHAAARLAALVEFGLDDPSVLGFLQTAAAELREDPPLPAVLRRVVDRASALMDTEFANVQLTDPDSGALVLVTQRGFRRPFLEHFAVVQGRHTVCGRAAGQAAQAVVEDVQEDQACRPHLPAFRAAGVRAVQSTPLVDRDGRLIGMLSTHAPRPGRPTARDLRTMDLYALVVGEVISRRLDGRADGGRNGTPSPGRATAPSGPVTGPGAAETNRLMSDTVNRLFSAGISLAGAQEIITDHHAAQRVQAGIDELDEAIRTIRLAALSLGLDGTTPRG